MNTDVSTEKEKVEVLRQTMLNFAIEVFANSKNKNGTELNIAMSIAHEFMTKVV